MWIIMSLMSAFFAGITSILAKCGIRKIGSNVAMAIRTIIILIFSLLIVFISGSFNLIHNITPKSLIFLLLSGVVTGVSWLFYFKAVSIGDLNKVAAIDKSSVVLSILFAIVLFKETDKLLIKLIGIVLILIGTIFMLERKQRYKDIKNNIYIVYAILSAIFAALTSILGKIGIDNIDSNLATLIRTFVILIISWIIIIVTKEYKSIFKIDRRELIFISLSGISTGASWLCYYYAIKNGIVSLVIPIDKLSIVVVVAFSYIFFNEKLSKISFIGLIFIVFGTIIMTF
ncbi:Bacterial transporter family protein [Candidatus Arthromitus sp. SFB-mouse-NL]|uniref:EamA family transporter n=1 Tax=Candidatus Arthromitus sp. SFB-mouse-NL TaxID=1508644 RepID=UPI00049B41B1|nr:EamA family transporter [Candidatus Arthromitus sp. SFB-mouse-NL]AID44973.1 Bacterial transporter family protein [Candidatus Arthromitus sp. SFB-mouse-NL]